MMNSMTGYGRGESAENGYKITVELSSVNRKQTEINIYLPRELESLEARVRDLINREIARGRVVARIGVHAARAKLPGKMDLDVDLAKVYARELKKLAAELGLEPRVTLDQLVRAPGVFRAEESMAEAELFWPLMERAVGKALAALVKMRVREGAHLSEDLQARIRHMEKSVDRVEKRAPLMVKQYREQLRQRIQRAGLEMPVADDERLLKEVVYFAERSDITEEITRLRSHFQQFRDCVKTRQPIGRTLDFLAQEINREINTIGAKSGDTQISREVVKLKADLEKFREQVQNVE